jgi:hypothetical protein
MQYLHPRKKQLNARRANKIKETHSLINQKQKEVILNKKGGEWKINLNLMTSRCSFHNFKMKSLVHFIYACVCHCTLYTKSVYVLHKSKYPQQNYFKIQSSFD